MIVFIVKSASMGMEGYWTAKIVSVTWCFRWLDKCLFQVVVSEAVGARQTMHCLLKVVDSHGNQTYGTSIIKHFVKIGLLVKVKVTLTASSIKWPQSILIFLGGGGWGVGVCMPPPPPSPPTPTSSKKFFQQAHETNEKPMTGANCKLWQSKICC